LATVFAWASDRCLSFSVLLCFCGRRTDAQAPRVLPIRHSNIADEFKKLRIGPLKPEQSEPGHPKPTPLVNESRNKLLIDQPYLPPISARNRMQIS
jgi:hypothetical protein